MVLPQTPDVTILLHNQSDITLSRKNNFVNAAQLTDFRYCGLIPERINKDQPSDDISYRCRFNKSVNRDPLKLIHLFSGSFKRVHPDHPKGDILLERWNINNKAEADCVADGKKLY